MPELRDDDPIWRMIREVGFVVLVLGGAIGAVLGVLALLLILAIGAARGAPPAPGSEDYELLMPHHAWIHGLRQPGSGLSCCDLSDCRPVDARASGARWQIRFRAGQVAGAPLDWTDVPDDVVIRAANPTGVPIACWFAGRIFCFVPAGAT